MESTSSLSVMAFCWRFSQISNFSNGNREVNIELKNKIKIKQTSPMKFQTGYFDAIQVKIPRGERFAYVLHQQLFIIVASVF